MCHSLSSVDDDDAAVGMDFLYDLLEIGEPTTVKIGGAVDNDNGVLEVFCEREATIVVASENDARDMKALAEGHGRKKGGVVFNVGSDDFLDVFGVDAV